ncbi:MAG: ATP-binding cassette domain-containing protein [Myxococcales bacterium]|nr:ATP-binding cassette domain-containing protein [Myxococcales bacterium]
MERSGLSNFCRVAPIAALDVAGRLAVPISVIAIAEGSALAAGAAALFVNVGALIRGLLAGRAHRFALEQVYRRLVAATRARAISELCSRPLASSSAMLAVGADRVARVATSTMPRLVADLAGFAALAAVAWTVTGAAWVFGAAAVAGVLGGFVALVFVRQRRTERAAHSELAELYAGLDALFEGSADLRAHGREQTLAEQLAQRTSTYASAQARASLYSTLLGVLPVGLALLCAVTLASTAELAQSVRLQRPHAIVLAAIGATALLHALSLVRTLEELVRSAPHRRQYADFVAHIDAATPARAATPEERASAATRSPAIESQVFQKTPELSGKSAILERPPGWLKDAVIELDGLSVQHPGASVATPADLRLRWAPGNGLALLGPNGSGKSTAALALLGLVPSARGRVLIDERALDADAFAALCERVAFVSQRPYVAPGRTVAWHLRMLAGHDLSDAELDGALAAVGLTSTSDAGQETTFAQRLAMTLSGGELRRAQLARILLPHGGRTPELIIVDEPEAGLDTEWRARIRELLAQQAKVARVLVIAHDPSVIPAGFETAACRRGLPGSTERP